MNPLLLPLVAAQAAYVHRTIGKEPRPEGPTNGFVPGPAAGATENRPETMRLLVIGDSSASGRGAPTHDLAFAGSMARAIAARTARPVQWRAMGKYGATSEKIRHGILTEVRGEWDLAVLLVGVNDILARRSTTAWATDLTAIVEALQQHAAHTVVPGIPEFDAFPSLPRTLRRYLAERGAALDTAARLVCAGRTSVQWVSSAELGPAEPSFFAADGFHASPAGYERWARAITDHLDL
ncbi:lysophospholipase L1-like esterase [Nocardioides albertanoniae]|uniref:Lysophospholipase L1-like esterase n=1 Tax=Nocardioides albertanoniae TaxID=1175486 RepID=A0A543A628_9ACTN|nr:SGNH/GDSL hydrolase family protein [Nocardioides albertanoniae]TQL67946.1 lysophospholipase L1-like esterase [Nocardioides albertanoniae]